jgi:hypothetical protein
MPERGVSLVAAIVTGDAVMVVVVTLSNGNQCKRKKKMILFLCAGQKFAEWSRMTPAGWRLSTPVLLL